MDDSGTDPQQGTNSDGGLDNPKPKDGNSQLMIGPACVPALTSPLFVLGIIVFILVVTFAAWRRGGFAPALVLLFGVSMVLFPAWLMLTGCNSDIPTNQEGGILPPLASGNASGGNAGGAAGTDSMFSPPVLLVGLVVVALVLALVVYRASGDDEQVEDTSVEEVPADMDGEETLTAIGDVAGEAANRIEEAVDAENEVYRAWHEMTTHLEVGNPRASTPTEFATAARDAGMDDTHVDSLTGLFQEVRYGGAEATTDREERAVDALRTIEDTYGGER